MHGSMSINPSKIHLSLFLRMKTLNHGVNSVLITILLWKILTVMMMGLKRLVEISELYMLTALPGICIEVTRISLTQKCLSEGS
jgi:hypothetical protein